MWCRHGIMYLIPQRRLSSVLNLKFTCCRFCFIFCLFFHLSLIKYNMMCRYFMNAESYHRVIRIVDGKKRELITTSDAMSIQIISHEQTYTGQVLSIRISSTAGISFINEYLLFNEITLIFSNEILFVCPLSLSFHLNMDIRIISVFVCCCFFLLLNIS